MPRNRIPVPDAVRGVALVLALALPAERASADDGVLEINQSCAVATGCFAGDAAGLPVTIAAPGSYRLTSNLVVPDENTDGIVVSASDVAIDLNRFSIVRAACLGATTICTPTTGSGSGVERLTSNARGSSLRNGSIIGMGLHGALLAEGAEAQDLRVRWNRQDGVNVGIGSKVAGVTAIGNGNNGIVVGQGSTVTSCSAADNGNDGFVASGGSTIERNAAYSNGNRGILTSIGATITSNSTYLNVGDGISAGTGSTVIGNSSYTNTGDGIACANGCIVQSNAVRNNGGFGLDLSLDSAYRENAISANQGGTVDGTGLVNLGNACNGSAVCP